MHVISENSPADMARNKASEQIGMALIELAANIVRIIRGAGKPNELVMQVHQLAEAMQKYRTIVGHFPGPAMYADALLLDTRHELLSRCSEDERARDYAEQMILRGALQVVASRMMQQLTIERAGDAEMHSGIRELERIHEENRRRLRAEMRASSGSMKRKKRTTPKPPKTIVF